jgi:hypothetical protein
MDIPYSIIRVPTLFLTIIDCTCIVTTLLAVCNVCHI